MPDKKVYDTYIYKMFLFLLVFCVYSSLKTFMLENPFHVDTMIYIDGVRGFIASKNIPDDFFFFHRIFNLWLYLPFYYFFGVYGIGVVTLFIYVLFGLFYMTFLTKLFGRLCAFFSFLLISFTPAALITVTHLKEDFNSLFFCFISLYLCLFYHDNIKTLAGNRKTLLCLLSGIVFGIGLLCKESAVFIFIFCVSLILFAEDEKFFTFDKMMNLASLLAGVFLCILLFCPLYARQIVRIMFSAEIRRVVVFSLSADIWKESYLEIIKGLYSVWFLLPGFFLGVFYSLKKREKLLLCFPFLFLVYLLFMGGSTGFRLRLSIWMAAWFIPFSVWGFLTLADYLQKRFDSEIIKPVKQIVVFFFLLVAVLNFNYVYPLLKLRKNINLVSDFYTKSAERIPDGSTVLGMDNINIFSFFAGDRLNYKKHSIRLSEQAIDIFVDDINKSILTGGRFFLIPDFFNYTNGHTKYFQEKMFETFVFHPVYSGLYSMYHHLDRFIAVSSYIKGLEKTHDAVFLKTEEKSVVLFPDKPDKLLIKEMFFQKSDSRVFSSTVFVYRDIVLPLRRASVVELKPKS